MTSVPSTKTRRSAALRRSELDRSTATRLAATEYARIADAVAALPASAWHNPTDCPDWDVHALVGHIVGMTEMAASIREGSRQRRIALRGDGVFIDELTDLQVREHAHQSQAELTGRLRTVGPKAAAGRRRTPGLIRRRPMPVEQTVNGRPERWAIGYLVDTILTRDPWMHRIDLSRATGQALQLTAEHDGVLVADVVDEWTRRHDRPYRLELSGPAGGTWGHGVGGPELRMDAVEFCRAVSRRAAHPGLLDTEVPF